MSKYDDDFRRPAPPFPATIEEAERLQRGFHQKPQAIRAQAPGKPITQEGRMMRDEWRATYGDVLRKVGLALGEIGVADAVVSCVACEREFRIPLAKGLSAAGLLCPSPKHCNQLAIEETQRPAESL